MVLLVDKQCPKCLRVCRYCWSHKIDIETHFIGEEGFPDNSLVGELPALVDGSIYCAGSDAIIDHLMFKYPRK